MASTFAERLREYRKLRNISQAEIADRLHVALNTISKIEHGARKVSFDEAVQIADVLHVRLEDLAGTSPSSPSLPLDVLARQKTQYETIQQSLEDMCRHIAQLATSFQEFAPLGSRDFLFPSDAFQDLKTASDMPQDSLSRKQGGLYQEPLFFVPQHCYA